MRYQAALAEKAKELGVHGFNNNVALKTLVEISYNGVAEENDEIQDIWANLFINAVNMEAGVDVKHAYISVLKDFGPIEARIMNSLYNNRDIAMKQGALAKPLPELVVSINPANISHKEENLPPEDTRVVI